MQLSNKMSQNMNNLSADPSSLTLREKMILFEKATEGRGIPKPPSMLNIFPGNNPPSKRPETSNSENNPSSLEITHPQTSTPFNASSSKSSNFGFWQSQEKKSAKKSIPIFTRHYSTESLHQSTSKPVLAPPMPLHQTASSSDRKREMKKVFDDLDTFIATELNEIEVRKRTANLNKTEKVKEQEKDNEDKFFSTLQELKAEVRQIKENQKEFQNKFNRHERTLLSETQKTRKRLEYDSPTSSIASSAGGGSKKKERPILKKPTPSKIQYATVEVHPEPPPAPPTLTSKPSIEPDLTNLQEVPIGYGSSTTTLCEQSRDEKIARLESELFKAETLMMKINRVLENVGKVDDNNIDSIINIERHYLVASTRFQSALQELRKANENLEEAHPPPFNRKGKLVIREIMLEVNSAYFQRKIPTKNEFLLVMIKYNDKVMASNPIRIQNDVRVIKFPELFSIPETYADFEMRMEIFGTTFWRKMPNSRETQLKKYGFVTFTLADTGKKHKRFHMIEVLQADSVPIRSKILMRISQKITPGIQYRGLLFVKIREIWYETSTHLNGHILEISFKSYNHNSLTQSRETIVLDLYNFDSDAVIPVDMRVSKRPNSFTLKFNHYVDVANFYLMCAADSPEAYAEWVSAINKVLVLIKH